MKTNFAASLAPPARSREPWGRCESCDRERRLDGDVMIQHNAWDGWQMVFCPGSGQEPTAVTTSAH